jgi:histidinol-phosphate aminotransferase
MREGVEHGGRRKGLIDFSISVNPYQPEWKGEIFRKAERHCISYPYFEELEGELSELVGEEISLVGGATEGIYLSVILLKRLGVKRVLIPAPTYSEYERVSRMFGLKIVKEKPDPEKIAKRIEKGDAVFFCNPNNPDGRYFDLKEMKPLVERVEEKEAVMVLDEAFKDFVKGFRSPESDNLIKLRTFTKSYGMPGIRVGYVAGFVSEIKSLRMPWSIGSVGKAFVEKVIDDSFRFLRESIPKVWKEKERIERELEVKSDANYFLMKFNPEPLFEKGLVVRDCTSFGLPGYIRFSVRRPEENSVLIDAITYAGSFDS